MNDIAQRKSKLIARFLLVAISLFNVYLYTVLSFILMRVFGFPYEAFSTRDLALAGLIMTFPLFLPFSYVLLKLKIEQMTPLQSRLAMLKFFAVTIPVLAVYCFAFMYLNINFAPAGEQLCAGKIVEKRRYKMKNGISHRFVIECESAKGKTFLIEKRVNVNDFADIQTGELYPLTYLEGRLGVDLLVNRER